MIRNAMQWAGTHPPGIVAAIILAAVLAGCGDLLDDNSADWQHSNDLQSAIQQAVHEHRFAQAAQDMCGPNAAWREEPDGSVACSTKHGRPTITLRVSP